MRRRVRRRSRAATGAPAQAITTLSPTERSSVLLPLMLEPLMIHKGVTGLRATSLATASVGAMRGCANAVAE